MRVEKSVLGAKRSSIHLQTTYLLILKGLFTYWIGFAKGALLYWNSKLGLVEEINRNE